MATGLLGAPSGGALAYACFVNDVALSSYPPAEHYAALGGPGVLHIASMLQLSAVQADCQHTALLFGIAEQ